MSMQLFKNDKFRHTSESPAKESIDTDMSDEMTHGPNNPVTTITAPDALGINRAEPSPMLPTESPSIRMFRDTPEDEYRLQQCVKTWGLTSSSFVWMDVPYITGDDLPLT